VVEQGVEAMWKQSGTSARAVHARKPPVYRHLWHVRGMWRQFLKTKTCFITNFFADVRCQSFCHIHLTSDNFLAYLRYLSENQVLVHTNSEESCTKIWKTGEKRRIFAMSKRNNDRK
jgi:hypothetical protein